MTPNQTMKSIALLILALALNMIALSVAFSQTSTSKGDDGTTSPPISAPDSISVENIVDDEKIVERIEGILDASGWFANIEVTSMEGFVIISGEASSDEHADWAETIAERTQDVIGVKNQIEVESAIDFNSSMMVVADSLGKLYRDFLLRLPFLAAGFVALLITWVVSLVSKLLLSRVLDNRERLRSSLRDLIKQLVSIAVWVFGILLATVIVFPGMTPAKALTVLGLGSVAIGFAFKDIFENFFAGVLILWRYPIEKGDFIQHDDVMGKVEEITIRNTMIRRTDGNLVVVPNGQLFKSNVEVLTNRAKRRLRILCGIGYGEDVATAREVIRKAVAACESVSGPKSVEVFANEFADSSINFEVTWWTGSTPVELRRSRDEVIEAIKSALDSAGIEIPFPYRTLTFKQPITVNQDVEYHGELVTS